jgi:hypothetical protein
MPLDSPHSDLVYCCDEIYMGPHRACSARQVGMAAAALGMSRFVVILVTWLTYLSGVQHTRKCKK